MGIKKKLTPLKAECSFNPALHLGSSLFRSGLDQA